MGPHSEQLLQTASVKTGRLKTQSNEILAFFGLCFWVIELNTRGVPSEKKKRTPERSAAVYVNPTLPQSELLQMCMEIFGRPAFVFSN